MPFPFLTEQSTIEQRIRDASQLWIGSDYDGTLAPYSDEPGFLSLPVETRQILHRLAQRPSVRLAIISGRDIPNLRQQVGLESVAYAGNHGLEIEQASERFVHPVANECRQTLANLCERLTSDFRDIPQAQVQNKQLSLTVHFRRVEPRFLTEMKRTLEQRLANISELMIHASASAWDIRPAIDWHKGAAVKWLREKQAAPGALAIVLGDDLSDEDAFAAAKDGITIVVGPRRPTSAQFHLEEPQSVREFLAQLLTWVRE